MKDVTIKFMDGTEEIVPKVSTARVADGVLILELRRESFGLPAWIEHIGSYPLVNIKSYKVNEPR